MRAAGGIGSVQDGQLPLRAGDAVDHNVLRWRAAVGEDNFLVIRVGLPVDVNHIARLKIIPGNGADRCQRQPRPHFIGDKGKPVF